MKPFSFIFFLMLLCWVNIPVYSQERGHKVSEGNDSVLAGCVEKDIFDIVFRRKPYIQDTIERLTSVFVPYVGYTPSSGFLLGLGGNFSFRLGRRQNTNLSAVNASIEVTTEKQIKLQMKSNVFAGSNTWFLQGDWRFYLFNIPTFGLGTGRGDPIPPVPGIEVPPGQEGVWYNSYRVHYNWLRLHETFCRNIGRDMYAGIGYHLDWHFDIVDQDLDVDSGQSFITPHYAYSTLHGYDPVEYTVSGLSLNFVYDTRDNLISPYKGYYVNINLLNNFKVLGSASDATMLYTEFRTYINVERKIPRHLVAFWLYGSFMLSGTVPYFDLRATGFDQMNSSGRGYIQGRWRGENLVYGEAEYRFPISRCSQFLGGALFVNATTASSKDLDTPLFGYIRMGAGFGLRFLLSKKNRTNLLLDFAFGDMSRGLYVQALEAF